MRREVYCGEPMVTYEGGYPCVEWYADDDGGSGFGDHAMVCRWFGRTLRECAERAKLPPPDDGWIPFSDTWHPDFDEAMVSP